MLRNSEISVRMINGGLSVANQFSAHGEYLQAFKKNGYGKWFINLLMIVAGLRGLGKIALAKIGLRGAG
jgi:hypothetical protein